MAPPKKAATPWYQCDNCKAFVVQKEADQHTTECPPSIKVPQHYFIKDQTLYGCLDIKSNEDIKNIPPQDRDNFVFLSQSVVQLCELSIGEYAILKDLENKFPAYARIVWPTNEKGLTSVLLTKNDVTFTFEKPQIPIAVYKPPIVKQAQNVVLVNLDDINMLELCPELQNRIQKTYLDKLLTYNNKIKVLFYGKLLKFEVKCIEELITEQLDKNVDDELRKLSLEEQPTFYKIVPKTRWTLFRNEEEYKKEIISRDFLLKIGGLSEEINEIRHLINVALGKSSVVLNTSVTKGVLLYGVPGTGKTLVANALAKESGTNVVTISLPNLYKTNTNPEETFTKLVNSALNSSPSIILIDEIDVFCPSKSSRTTDSDKKFMAGLLNMFDCINESSSLKVFVMATSNKPDSIDPSFRRCGRLDREIEIPIPNPACRMDILKKLLKDVPHEINSEELKEIANSAHGFVGSDLVLLCSTAGLHVAKNQNSKITFKDLTYSLTHVKPSAMREVQIEVPNVKWSDIGGQHNLKLILRQAIEWPLKYPESFIRLGVTPPRGILMFGPPGCSKTMIAKALATESGLNFLSIKGPELFSKWVGESERAVREVFRKARQVAPSVIFFDEIDALGGERTVGSNASVQERVLTQLLTELDGVSPLGDVTVLAATNRPDKIDKALLRPGRLDRIVYVSLPDRKTREEIFKLKFIKMPVVGVDIIKLIDLTEGYSGAEVNAVCHEAAIKALEEDIQNDKVEMKHFEMALKIITPRTLPSLLKLYEEYLNTNSK